MFSSDLGIHPFLGLVEKVNGFLTVYFLADLQFNSKVEAKITAKVAEKNQAEAKTQEEADEEIKQLRKSLRFKATPMPNFYQEAGQPKMESKKIPPTRAKSPKLGRKANATINNLEGRSLSMGPAEAPNQPSKVRAVSDCKETSGFVRRTRNASVQSKKASEVSGLVEERPRNQSSFVEKISDVKDSGVGTNSLDSCGESLKPLKITEELEVKVSTASDCSSDITHNFEEEQHETLVLNDSMDLKKCCLESTPTTDVNWVDQSVSRKGHCVSTELSVEEVAGGKARVNSEFCGIQSKIHKRDITPRRGSRMSPGSCASKPWKESPAKQNCRSMKGINGSKNSHETGQPV
ncbi:hypothetical protein L7F22_002304 [Adiantum nelumboides]|nr:hypothetical protein [Adiantum nelumboides]